MKYVLPYESYGNTVYLLRASRTYISTNPKNKVNKFNNQSH